MRLYSGQEKVILATTLVLLLTGLIVGLFLFIKRAPESELGDVEFFAFTSGESAEENNGSRILYTAGQFGSPGEVNLWKTSGDFFTISVPHEWEINQRDAQGMSSIVFFDPQKPNLEGEVILQSASEFVSGELVAYDEWIADQLRVLGEVEPCSSLIIGGLQMTCFSAEVGDQTVTYYFTDLNPELFVRVAKVAEPQKITPLWSVVNSINFTPSTRAVDDALVIP